MIVFKISENFNEVLVYETCKKLLFYLLTFLNVSKYITAAGLNITPTYIRE